MNVLVAFLVFLLPVHCQRTGTTNTSSANQSNISNVSNVTNVTDGPCRTLCCGFDLRKEANNACMDFEMFGVDDVRCGLWKDAAQASCQASCSNCTIIAQSIYDQCMFTLVPKMVFTNAESYCKETRKTFALYRCPSACINKATTCFGNKQFDYCNSICGNFYNCQCSRQQGQAGAPDKCVGDTIIPNEDGTPGSCSQMPQTCKNNWPGTDCGLYRHCSPDVCVLKNVKCPVLDPCAGIGVCAPSDGQCYYANLPDGSDCDDGLFYTHQDTCSKAVCQGVPDYCQKNEPVCETFNPCLVPTGRVKSSCDPLTGSCVFDPLPDGTPCSSGILNTSIDGYCSAGICRQNNSDLCRNVRCQSAGQCFQGSVCDPFSGKCSRILRPEGSPCSTGTQVQPDTGICIEGVCFVRSSASPVFVLEGQGDCLGKTSVTSRTRYYFASVVEPDTCKQQCSDDPSCIAYAFGYYTCLIYGGNRSMNPDTAFWGLGWMLQDPDSTVNFQHDMKCYSKTFIDFTPPEIDLDAAWFGVTITIVMFIPTSWIMCVYFKPISRSFKKVTGCCASSIEDEIADVSYETGDDNFEVLDIPKILKSPKGDSRIAADPNIQSDFEIEKFSNGDFVFPEVILRDPRGEVQLKSTRVHMSD